MSIPLRCNLARATACLLLAGCAAPAPEQALREAVDELEAAVDAREADAFKNRLAEDFIGPQGLDRNGARRMAQVLYLRHRDVEITTGPLDIALQQDHATVRFEAALTGGSGGLLPDSAQVYEVTTGWRLQDGEWRMTSAQWLPRL